MATEYICFSCGNHYVVTASDTKCPKCGSSNVLKLNAQSLYGLFGGGG